MSKYLVSNPDATDQIIEPLAFIDSIKSYWHLDDTSVQNNMNEGNTRAVSWFIRIEERRIDGCLFKNGHLVLDGDIVDCSNFALWYRQQIPEQLKLVFYDESYSADIELTNDTTAQDIISAFCE